MKKIMITGGAGFIGSAVVRQFIAETDVAVISVDKLTYAGNLDSLPGMMGHPRHIFEQVDICDAREIARVFAQHQLDSVMHLAAESHVDRSIDGPAAFIQANNIGGHNERTDLEVVNAICGRLYELAPRGTGVLRRNSPMSMLGPVTKNAMPSTPAATSANSAGSRGRYSRVVCARPCSGTWTTVTGANRSSLVSAVAGSSVH